MMHYYQHHIGDYRRDTAHLTLLEHGVYRQLLDWAYLDNDPIPKETETVYRRLSARTDEEKKAVDIVLAEFFSLDIGYTQKRAELEKQAYERKAATARIAGKLGGRPRKTEEVISGLTKKTDAKANQEPITNNHKPIKEKSAVAPHLLGIPEKLLSDFLKLRKAKKGGELTETALAGIAREAAKAGLTLVEAITACCEYSWVGFNAGWYADRNQSKSGVQTKTPHKFAAAAHTIFGYEADERRTVNA
jgi:uncharacterized protein YdaU (DUF1376 family)